MIAQICAPGAIGGLERVVQCLSIGLVEAGHRVHVVAVHVPGTDIEEFAAPIRRAGATVHDVTVGGRAYFEERRLVSALLRAVRADVVHFHGYRSDLLHRRAARRFGAVTVSTLHGSSRVGGLAGLYERVHERSLRGLDAVVSVSRPLADELRRWVHSDRLHTIPNALPPTAGSLTRDEARRTLELPPGGPVIGWVGRLVPVKGPDVLLSTLAEMRAVPWTACLIGDGPDLESLRRMATALELGDRVRFAGAIPNAGRLLPAFDALAITSRSEGTPMVLLEAMQARVPVVSTDVGGIPDVLSSPDLGWTVPLGDLHALGAALTEALQQPARALARAANAQAHVNDAYGSAAWIQRHESLYRALLKADS